MFRQSIGLTSQPVAQHYGSMPYGDIQNSAKQASILLKAMSNERRLLILCHLSEGEHSVGELCALVGLSQSALSQHLAKLRHDGLVATRRSKQTVYYSVAAGEVESILQTLHELYCAERPVQRPHTAALASS